MSYKVKALDIFERQAKKLVKKYASLQFELQELISELKENPLQGDRLKHNCYKVRLGIASKGKGKSGGARIITYVQITGTTVYLLSIYDKSEQDSISDAELKVLMSQIHD